MYLILIQSPVYTGYCRPPWTRCLTYLLLNDVDLTFDSVALSEASSETGCPLSYSPGSVPGPSETLRHVLGLHCLRLVGAEVR